MPVTQVPLLFCQPSITYNNITHTVFNLVSRFCRLLPDHTIVRPMAVVTVTGNFDSMSVYLVWRICNGFNSVATVSVTMVSIVHSFTRQPTLSTNSIGIKQSPT